MKTLLLCLLIWTILLQQIFFYTVFLAYDPFFYHKQSLLPAVFYASSYSEDAQVPVHFCERRSKISSLPSFNADHLSSLEEDPALFFLPWALFSQSSSFSCQSLSDYLCLCVWTSRAFQDVIQRRHSRLYMGDQFSIFKVSALAVPEQALPFSLIPGCEDD